MIPPSVNHSVALFLLFIFVGGLLISVSVLDDNFLDCYEPAMAPEGFYF